MHSGVNRESFEGARVRLMQIVSGPTSALPNLPGVEFTSASPENGTTSPNHAPLRSFAAKLGASL